MNIVKSNVCIVDSLTKLVETFEDELKLYLFIRKYGPTVIDKNFESLHFYLVKLANHKDSRYIAYLKILLEEGVDLRITDANGRTLLHYLMTNGMNNEWELLDTVVHMLPTELLVSDLLACASVISHDLLMEKEEATKFVQKWIQLLPAGDCRQAFLDELLVFCIKRKDVDSVAWLLEWGADPNQTILLHSPDFYASLLMLVVEVHAQQGDPDTCIKIMKLLLEHGADPEFRGSGGHNAYTLASRYAYSLFSSYGPYASSLRFLDMVRTTLRQYAEF